MRVVKKPFVIVIAILLVSSMLITGALADAPLAYGAATVNTPVLNMRTGPSTSASVVSRLSEGDIIVVLERTNDDWYKVNFHGTSGYVSAPLLRDVILAENFNAMGRVTGDKVNLREKPSIDSDILGTYTVRTDMTVIGINNGWYKVRYDNKTGYIRSDYMEIVSGQKAASASSTPSSTPSANLALGQQIADFALSFLGTDYVYGGMSPSGFDCSGFSSYVYKNFGYTLTRNASGQYRDNGVRVNKSDLSVGDLVFFSSNGGASVTHVGIYIGDSEFVHASRTGIGVVISRLDSTYYMGVWFGAKRIIT